MKGLSRLEKWALVLLLVAVGGIVLQAPLSVAFGTLWPVGALLIKAWADVVLIIDAALFFLVLRKKQQLRLLKTPLLLLVGAYIVWYLLLLPLNFQGWQPALAGLILDLNYLVAFGLVYICMQLWPEKRRLFITVGAAGALVVTGFAILQVTVLPHDVLKYLGYNSSNIAPYITIDRNAMFVRINSTLRGPNPLGAYAVIVLTVLLAVILAKRLPKAPRVQIAAAVLAVGGLVALGASYSRSAWIGAIAAFVIVAVVGVGRKLSRRTLGIISIVSVAVIGIAALGAMLVGGSVLSNVLLHDNPTGGSATQSNEGHITSLLTAGQAVLTHPLGGGIGSTGSPSLFGPHPFIVENQYLLTAHESGWIGLVLLLIITIWILRLLWRRRSDYLALGAFASGIGLLVVGLLLPVWADDTVAIVWWSLAAVALAGKVPKRAK